MNDEQPHVEKNNGNLSSTPDSASGTDGNPVRPTNADSGRVTKPGQLEEGDHSDGMTSLNQPRVHDDKRQDQ